MSLKTVVRSTAARLTMSSTDVRALLHQDHLEALDVAKRMHESKSTNIRKALFDKLKPALSAHSRAEERVVYNALLKVKSKESHDYGNEGYVEHGLLDELLKKLTRTDAASDAWKAQAKVLFELLDHHIGEEQRDVFSDLGEHFSSAELETMGTAFAALKAREKKVAAPLKRKPAKKVSSRAA